MRSTAPDGITKASIGSWSSSGAAEVEGDFLCTPWDTDVVKSCVAIVRNPGGSHEKQNEYVLLPWNSRLEFSVMK